MKSQDNLVRFIMVYLDILYYTYSTFELSEYKFSKPRISKLLPMLNIKLYHSVCLDILKFFLDKSRITNQICSANTFNQ
jgi:hypothetical protein